MSQTEDNSHEIVPDGMEAYGITIIQDGRVYLEASDQGGIQAYTSIEKAREIFQPFVDKLRAHNYETHSSGGLALNMLRPKVIKFPKAAQDLITYLASKDIYELSGIGLGYHIKMKGILVNDNIKDLVVFDIAHESIKSMN